MKKTRGFYLIEVVLAISLVLLMINVGSTHFNNLQEEVELKKAKTQISEIFSTYASKAKNYKKKYKLEFDYLEKTICISNKASSTKKTFYLPENLSYLSIFEGNSQTNFLAFLTENGNITPSFSIYIFDSHNIARYRISLYGFDFIKYMKINVYKNLGDRNATYSEIQNYHKSWTTNNPSWEEE